MKKCRRCKKEKPLFEFHKESKSKDGVHSYCKVCRNIDRRKHHKKARKFYVEYKKGLNCQECGEDNHACLEFHHRNPNKKEFNIGCFADKLSARNIMSEIAKCDVLCANCHKKLHFRERGIIVAYSKDEIKEFKAKDLRISKLAIVKSLIEKLPLEDIYEVEKVNELVEKYVDYVYAERKDTTKRGQIGCVVDNTRQKDWEQVAIGLNFAIPTSQNIKILNQVADGYKKAHKASANPTVAGMSPADILVHILDTFGKYPVKTESVEKVVKSLTENFER